MMKHPSHKTRFSDSSFYDEVCVNCGATDRVPGGWGDLAKPCPKTDNPAPSGAQERAPEVRGAGTAEDPIAYTVNEDLLLAVEQGRWTTGMLQALVDAYRKISQPPPDRAALVERLLPMIEAHPSFVDGRAEAEDLARRIVSHLSAPVEAGEPEVRALDGESICAYIDNGSLMVTEDEVSMDYAAWERVMEIVAQHTVRAEATERPAQDLLESLARIALTSRGYPNGSREGVEAATILRSYGFTTWTSIVELSKLFPTGERPAPEEP